MNFNILSAQILTISNLWVRQAIENLKHSGIHSSIDVNKSVLITPVEVANLLDISFGCSPLRKHLKRCKLSIFSFSYKTGDSESATNNS